MMEPVDFPAKKCVTMYNVISSGCWDPVMEWWANIVGVAAAWLLADTARASEIGDRLYILPEPLSTSEDPLPGYELLRKLVQTITK